jgi:tetratricopeptide (TPR) repeat protein
VIGKFIEDSPDSDARAEDAFRRALQLNPRLSVAHKYYSNLESEMGQTRPALVRLLNEAGRHGNDPELFAGLVHAGRYCGLFEQSVRAHEEARRLDPNVPTSLEQTLLLAGDIERILALERPLVPGGGDEVIRIIGLGLAGRREEAIERLHVMRQARTSIATFQTWTDYLMAWLERRVADMLAWGSEFTKLKVNDDPEAIFQDGWLLCDVGEHQRGLPELQRAVSKGYFVAPTLAASPQFDALRGDGGFKKLLAEAEAGREQALAAFREAGGERLLGR